jgi:hypothetical protein
MLRISIIKVPSRRIQKQVSNTMDAPLIFRIKSNASLYSEDPSILSFRHGQEFFVIGTMDASFYIVTTNKSLPFARGSVTGKVPMSHFASRSGQSLQQRRNQYHSQKAAVSTSSSSKEAYLSLSLPPAPKKARYSISLAGLTSGQSPAFKLVVQSKILSPADRRRSTTMQYIHQTPQELFALDSNLRVAYQGISIPSPPSGGDLVENLGNWATYLTKLGGFISRHVVDREGVFADAEQVGRKRADSGLALDFEELSLF